MLLVQRKFRHVAGRKRAMRRGSVLRIAGALSTFGVGVDDDGNVVVRRQQPSPAALQRIMRRASAGTQELMQVGAGPGCIMCRLS